LKKLTDWTLIGRASKPADREKISEMQPVKASASAI
jgi:hypothetical protein